MQCVCTPVVGSLDANLSNRRAHIDHETRRCHETRSNTPKEMLKSPRIESLVAWRWNLAAQPDIIADFELHVG